MSEPTYFDAVRTRRLEVEDDDGAVRAVVYCLPDSEDAVMLELRTPKQNASVVVYADNSGVGVQAWSRGNQKMEAWLRVDGLGQFEVYGPDGGTVLSAGTEGGG